MARRMAKGMTPERREAFYGLRTFSLSDVVLFPASAPSSRRLVKAFPFSLPSGRTRKVFSNGRFVSIVESGIGAPSIEIIGNLVCKGGAKVLLRIDFCGALSADVGVGDIFIASSARSFDQVSGRYCEDETVPADSRSGSSTALGAVVASSSGATASATGSAAGAGGKIQLSGSMSGTSAIDTPAGIIGCAATSGAGAGAGDSPTVGSAAGATARLRGWMGWTTADAAVRVGRAGHIRKPARTFPSARYLP